MDLIQNIASQLNLKSDQVDATIALLDEGNTLPFIARYRKEMTQGLDEEQIRGIQDTLESLRALDERRTTILTTIINQGNLTPDLEKQILQAKTRTVLEDLYLPYKPKRRTRASIAREKGLEGLADVILRQERTRDTLADVVAPYLTGSISSPEEAWAGARDIIAEVISDNALVRQLLREKALKWGILQASKTPGSEDERRVYEVYYDIESRVEFLRPHQILALHRGETEKVLKVSLLIPERDWINAIGSVYKVEHHSLLADELLLAIQDCAERLLLPAIERDVRGNLFERAERHAIGVFSSNLRSLLMQPPITERTVLGIDPGFRTGCKIAVVDPTGKVLGTDTIFPHEPQKKWVQSKKTLEAWIERYGVSLIAIGNGTASRETEQHVVEIIRSKPSLSYIITNEAGASVYSASPLARKELPQLDVSLRGAVSIARRVQDPLAELVKIDPKSIGVGLYQHDVDQRLLEKALEGVVEEVVNRVGVDVNTASPSLLGYVAGIGPKLAEQIVEFRDVNGVFKERKSMMDVPKLGPKAYQQAVGFLRINGGKHPFDASAIHPESYQAAQNLLQMAGLTLNTPISDRREALEQLQRQYSLNDLSSLLGIGIPTIMDILEQLILPGRDPRLDLPLPILRNDVLSMEDLKIGMRLRGTVRNVVDFGIFIDIGVKQDGLLHRSQVPQGNVLSVGAVILVEILKVEPERGRISLGWAE
jgi:protein Tex